MDIAAHMAATNHQNIIPINDNMRVQMKNISYSEQLNKEIIKKWKRLIKHGDITEVAYKEPRKCLKCPIIVEDAIDMFKHIKDVHIRKTNLSKSNKGNREHQNIKYEVHDQTKHQDNPNIGGGNITKHEVKIHQKIYTDEKVVLLE